MSSATLPMKCAPVIFSGHNERAVVALCRFLFTKSHDFFLVASHAQDAILLTDYKHNVLMQRQSSVLTVNLMAEIAQAVQERGFIPSLCSTSEFLNQFLLDNAISIQSQGWRWLLPSKQVYLALSSKESAPEQVQKMIGLCPSLMQMPGCWQAPCVLKPRNNVHQGEVLYPQLCKTDSELKQVLTKIDAEFWFSQEWVEGQSFYLCAYLDSTGDWDAFWQENLLQQPFGKSILLARTCGNPGLDVDRLMGGLHQLGYRGPFMMEIIQDCNKTLRFIEINPRFWGPLDLARRACPDLLYRYLCDLVNQPMSMTHKPTPEGCIYAWAYGARNTPLKVYPAAASLTREDIDQLLHAHDVYAYPDTQALAFEH